MFFPWHDTLNIGKILDFNSRNTGIYTITIVPSRCYVKNLEIEVQGKATTGLMYGNQK